MPVQDTPQTATLNVKRRKAYRRYREGKTMTITETQATTATEGKRGRGRPRKDEGAPEFDFSALTVATGVSMPKQERAKEANPFVTHVQESFENEDARAVIVPEVQAKRVESLIRRAADILTETPGATARVGVSVHISDPVDGNVTITFAAKERRARKGEGNGTEVAETPAP